MKRRSRTPLYLLATVVLLGVAVHAQLRRERAQGYDPLTALDPAALHNLAVTCNACQPRRFEKVDGHWRMLEPFARAADDARIERLAAIARAPVRYRHPADHGLDPGKLGLEPPQATLLLDGTLLKFGTTDAIHGDRYVDVGGVIALVPDRFSALLFATPESELAEPK